jgi:hypothetical protein
MKCNGPRWVLQNFSSYFRENTVRLHYKDQSLNAVFCEDHMKLLNIEFSILNQMAYIECNCKVGTNFGQHFHTPKQERMSTSTCIRKHLICELQLKEYCTCMMVLRHILAVRDVLNNTYHDGWLGRGGGPTAWPPRSPDLNPLHFYLWGHLTTLVYAAPVDNEEAHRIVDACQTIRNYPRIFQRTQQSMMRRVKACIVSHGRHFEHLL